MLSGRKRKKSDECTYHTCPHIVFKLTYSNYRYVRVTFMAVVAYSLMHLIKTLSNILYKSSCIKLQHFVALHQNDHIHLTATVIVPIVHA